MYGEALDGNYTRILRAILNDIERYARLWCNVRGVMVIFVGNGHGDKSSNPGRD